MSKKLKNPIEKRSVYSLEKQLKALKDWFRDYEETDWPGRIPTNEFYDNLRKMKRIEDNIEEIRVKRLKWESDKRQRHARSV